ncbi:GNAT family N-acetyltransferase (plasmid) [Streptomyces sp. NBC_01255]|uniref:GNAT family N-acetyltransferase n=1 Tax=Streptomyces sp. NBC_01255 TaxID=2903798 RepID=UPI002E370799|nr:GNAT family N-acetyltransferase [Streptomyces sp. NBC_01255]
MDHGSGRQAERAEQPPVVMVRPIIRNDVPTVMELCREAAEPFPAEKLGDHLDGPTAENQFALALVAESDGEVIAVVAGAALAMDLDDLSVSREMIIRRMALLDLLAVRADRRGEGLGRRLAETFIEWYQEREFRIVIANIAPGRHDLVSLYKHWGWHVGAAGAGLAIQIVQDPVLINEEPTRTAWIPLSPEVRQSLSIVPGISVVTGIFE